jgi:hypothetical protein
MLFQDLTERARSLRRQEREKHGLAQPMALTVEELDAAEVLQQLDHRDRHGAGAREPVAGIENLRCLAAAHADHTAQHDPRLEHVGAVEIASFADEIVSLAQPGQSLIEAFVAGQPGHRGI